MWCEGEPDEYEEDDAECYIFWYCRALLTLTVSVQSSVFAFLTGKCSGTSQAKFSKSLRTDWQLTDYLTNWQLKMWLKTHDNYSKLTVFSKNELYA